MFTIVENQHRADGVINQIVTNRQTFASALSFYHDRFSKMVMTELYPSVDLVLLDEKLSVIQHGIIPTLWTASVEGEPVAE